MNERIACKFAACSAFIYFAKTNSGRYLPLDAQPFPREDLRPPDRWLLTEDARAVREDGTRTTENQEESYVAHFVTCPGHLKPREQEKQRNTQPKLAARLESYRRTQEEPQS